VASGGSSATRPAKRSESPVCLASRTLTPKRVPSCRSAPILARLSIEMRTSGGCSETDMNALAVIPCTCSPTRAVSTVTPVANIPSVRRKASAGSPSSPSPSSSASDMGATSYEAPNASADAMALAIATSNSGGWDSSTERILTQRKRRPWPPLSSVRDRLLHWGHLVLEKLRDVCIGHRGCFLAPVRALLVLHHPAEQEQEQ